MSTVSPEKYLYKTVAEQTEPIVGNVTKGQLPNWINGRLMRNGPGKMSWRRNGWTDGLVRLFYLFEL